MAAAGHRPDKHRAAHDVDELARRIARLARSRWSVVEDLQCFTLGLGEEEVTLYARPAAADAFLETVSAAGAALEDARAQVETLQKRVAMLEREVATAREAESKAARPGTTRGAMAAKHAESATLENVPAALIAPFHPNARTLAAAKEDPLLALAVQATRAMQSDVNEVERARLLAMAYAASTGDMTRFWAARTQRSAKKLRPS